MRLSTPVCSRLLLIALVFAAGCSEDGQASSAATGPGTGAGGAGVTTGGGGDPGTGGQTSASSSGNGSTSGSGGAGGAPVLEDVHLVGRFDQTDPATPRFAWSGTSISATFSGAEIGVALDGDGNNYFEVIVDGVPTEVLVTQGGPVTYPLASGLAAGEHRVEIFRRAEAFQGVVQFDGFVPGAGAALVPSVWPYAHRMEFIGDSITAGYGALAANPCSFTPETESAYVSYASVAARNLEAAAHIIAWSGKGVYQNYDGDTYEPMPALYPRTIPQDPSLVWDPAAFPAEVVVINLGTNDFSVAVSQASFVSAYADLVRDVREAQPTARIYAVGGPFLGATPTDYIAEALATVADPGATLLELPGPDPEDGFGCDYHPSTATHAKLGQILTDRVKQDLGW
jgi:lysophospholipase L1-like esterase